jgi:putative membrane protein
LSQRKTKRPARSGIGKISLFVLVALLSIYPTVQFLSWSKSLKQGQVPAVDPGKLMSIRRIIHWELAAIVLLILCAAVMAKGIGHLG